MDTGFRKRSCFTNRKTRVSGPLFISSGDLIADRRYDLARGYAADGDLAAAADLYAQAVELAPGFASAWFALGEAREALGDRDGARAAFAQARDTDPQDRHGAGLPEAGKRTLIGTMAASSARSGP